MKFWSIFIFIIGCVLIWSLRYITELEPSLILTYEGLWASISGVILTLWQVVQLKDTTKATKEAVKATRKQMDLILSVSDVSKHVANLRFVKEYLTSDKIEMARLRLGDVKDFMSKIGYIDDLDYDNYTYKRLINSLEANLNSIEQEMNKTQLIDKNVFCKDLEKVASFLMDVENKLKSRKYE